MTRDKMKSMFVVHTNGEDEWIKIPKRTYDKMIDKLDEQLKECKRKNQRIMELEEELESFYNFSKTVSSAKP
jgi:hypothetical protein